MKKFHGKPVQAKLCINELDDVYEQEADRVAEQVMRMPYAKANEQPRDTGTRLVQRRATTGSAEMAEAPPIVHDVVNSPGQPLDAATRAFFEPRFGHDFSHVRIHADHNAAQSAEAVGASAYTVGRDVVFGTRRYSPRSPIGQRLLAHELAHVIQQEGDDHRRTLRRTPGTGPEPEKNLVPGLLSTGLAGSHEIVIDGEPFDLVVMSEAPSSQNAAARYRDTVAEYLGSYPSLGNGTWAFVVRQRDGVLAQTGGNCLGWANGTYGVNDPPEQVWGLVQPYLESIRQPVRGRRSPLETYIALSKKGTIPAHAMWDYFMEVQFEAVPAESDSDAHLALYGAGFGGPMQGPTHIAFQTAGGEFWVSKPSPSRFPLVHERASQMSGGSTGEALRLYKRASGPPDHVTVRAKPNRLPGSPQGPPSQ